MRTTVERVCVRCGGGFRTRDTRPGKGRCCSSSCSAALAAVNRNQSGPNNNNWRGGGSAKDRRRRYAARRPERHAAHLALTRAIRSGLLVRGPCEVCGHESVEGHHDDYAMPLVVRWLCKQHHMDAHGGRLA